MPPPTPPSDTSRWFAEEVQPHEAVLRAYLHRRYPTLRDVDDLVQESYFRVMRAKAQGTPRSAKGFLFETARNAACDIFRRQKPTVSLEAVVEIEGLRVLEDRPDAAEENEFATWRCADPRHQAAYARLAAGAEALSRLGELRPAGTSAVDPDLPLVVRRRKVVWLPLSLAAAALAIGFFALRPGTGPSSPAAAPVAVESVRQLNLPDGSSIDLNTGASVEEAFSPTERRVRLIRSEAHFAVAKDAVRPFVVETSGVAVRAVGTAFTVRLGAGTVEVLVTEGKVRVDNPQGASLLSPRSGSEPPVVAAGERVTVALAQANQVPAAVVRPEPAEIARLRAWQERRLDFDPTPLAEIVAAFNRVNKHQIVIEDASLGALRIGGSFKADDPDTLGRLLETNFGVAAERETERTFLRAKP